MEHWTKKNRAHFEQRNRAVCDAYEKADATYASVGDAFGLSRERTRQIVKSAERRLVRRCRACHPQHFWVGDIFFGDHSTLIALDKYELREHEPIEMMAELVYQKFNPQDRNRARTEIYRSAATRLRAKLESPPAGFLEALRAYYEGL